MTIQDKSSVYVTVSFPAIAFTFPEILSVFTIICKGDSVRI